MTTDLDTFQTADAELSNAFASQVEQPQQAVEPEQQTPESVETPPDSSSTGTETNGSSSTTPPSREEILASLTLEELTAHPTLGRELQSWKDAEAAKKLKGTRDQVRKELEEEQRFSNAKRRFESMSPEELGEELSKNPESRALYARIQTAPSPPPIAPEVSAQIDYYANVIMTTQRRMAKLPQEIQQQLDPKTHLVTPDGGDPTEVLAAWTDKVNAAIIAAGSNKTPEEEESDRLNREASNDSTQGGGLLTNGQNRNHILPDIEKGDADDLLADAFAHSTPIKRR